jgi:hypothetical protein
MAESRLDLVAGVDRFMFISGVGHMMGLPTRPGTSSAAVTGIPINGIAGFGPGALFHNFKGAAGSALYLNTGTNLSATWLNIG